MLVRKVSSSALLHTWFSLRWSKRMRYLRTVSRLMNSSCPFSAMAASWLDVSESRSVERTSSRLHWWSPVCVRRKVPPKRLLSM